MSQPVQIRYQEADAGALTALAGRIAVFADAGAALSPLSRRLDRAAKGALARAVSSEAFAKLKPGEGLELAFPAGLACDVLHLVRLARRTDAASARKAGATLGAAHDHRALTVLAESHPRAAAIAEGFTLRAYGFETYRSAESREPGEVAFLVGQPGALADEAAPLSARADGVLFARDLVNEPANVLTTTEFATRLAEMRGIGLEVEVLEEAELSKLGMRALLAVGQGSESPSKVVVMQWKGGAKGEAPLALVGKGVCFDTGGVSLKPAAGMEDMVMDMGGAATVAGVMRTLALRKARANVVGLVGLVENMPDGKAQRPGDVVRSMKGDTIEVINTDAEGRLVLADVLWYAQDRFSPRGVIDLATLTGAIIVALGAENTGVFSNDDTFCNAFLRAAQAEGEGAWRMPLGEAYDALLKSRLADMRNSCGREAGSVTAAQFLHRFIRPGMPWIHLDIAGTAWSKAGTPLSPKGATGWGVRALDRLIADRYEG
ncbi:leucyl aminopeptidase [Pseudogemmobacter humi]|uniref:Probable cytosol aminopeptidase n=1 Tax=Pseudogemmobacter humi TaxID=2483812 RepID=A0A3P5X6F3_9RHOB|nr:leucyl aminopeptidase [Pseudogemmobacter humi]VDC30137.1 Cytosol aminopeptidase [Pseudogemmobacter humi]